MSDIFQNISEIIFLTGGRRFPPIGRGIGKPDILSGSVGSINYTWVFVKIIDRFFCVGKIACYFAEEDTVSTCVLLLFVCACVGVCRKL